MMRVLPIARIPSKLWVPKVLRLPEALSRPYVCLLEKMGLRDLSVSNDPGHVHGGRSEHETHEHFARRFGTCAGRLEYVVLAPAESFSKIGNAFLTSFTTGHVAVLDIPCGAGATSGALICTLIELRRSKVMPRLPLTITVCGGDYAPAALTLCKKIMDSVVDSAANEGITIRFNLHEWEATRGDNAAMLMDKWFESCGNATEHFVIVSNFSGALKRANQFDAFNPILEQILARLYNKTATLVWLEPRTNDAQKNVVARVVEFLKRRVPWFTRADGNDELQGADADYQAENPVSGTTFRTTVLVHAFDRR